MQTVQTRLAPRARGKKPSPIRDLMRFMSIDGMISLGGGYPNPGTFMFEQFTVAFKGGIQSSISGSDLIQATQYGPSDAFLPLKNDLRAWHGYKDGVQLAADQIVTLNGSQEGLFIMAYLFLEEDDYVLLSEPSYPGAISAFRAFTKNFLSVPLDAHGMQTEVVAELLADRRANGQKLPKFIYTIPNGHNPGGVALSPNRRQQLIEIAQEFDVLILEDDPYQLVKLEETVSVPSLQSLDTTGRVVRLDSFSKIFAPGLRIGYVSGAAEIVREFLFFKQFSNLHTSTFIQTLLHAYFTEIGFEAFLGKIRENCRLYRTNRDAMIDAAKLYLPADVRFNTPGEGMFIWFELPEQYDTQRMIEQFAAELKVVLVPGNAFSTRDGLRNFMRASFSLVTPPQIEEGMRRFGEMVQRELR